MNRVEYEKGLEKLKQKNPGHDIIPVLIERGYDYLAVEYLKIALKEDGEASEVTLSKLYKQKDTLYSRRAVISNKFHSCETVHERAEISIAIGSIQTEIIANRQLLKEYHETGKLPKPTSKLTLPFDGARKQMKLHSMRTSISRYRGLIRKETNAEKVKKYEEAITTLQHECAELAC